MTKALRLVFLMLALAVGAGAEAADKPAPAERVIQVTAKKFEFTPSTIELKLGEPAVLELTTADRRHGFEVPELHLAATIKPGKPIRLRVVPDKVGEFTFHCNVFCGHGHEDMTGKIVVKP